MDFVFLYRIMCVACGARMLATFDAVCGVFFDTFAKIAREVTWVACFGKIDLRVFDVRRLRKLTV